MTSEAHGGMAERLAQGCVLNALARIAYLADTGEIDEYLSCYTRNAVWELASSEGLPISGTVLKGHEAIRASVLERRAQGLQGPSSGTAHAISTTSITFEGNSAHANSLFQYFTRKDGEVLLLSMGRYSDTFVEQPSGHWLLAHRIISQI